MLDKRKNADSANLERIYSLLVALKSETAVISSQIRTLRNEIKGGGENGKKI